MAEAASTLLLEKVEQILKHYSTLVAGAETELQNLESDLRLLKACFRDVSLKKDQTFREIERQIRDDVYEAEDTIDTYLTQAAADAAAATAKTKQSRVRKFFSSNASKISYVSKKISLAGQVQSLREKMKPKIKMVEERIGKGSGTSVEPPSTRLKKTQTIRKDFVVGFEDEAESIINHLKEERAELDVISIIGMPGLGKTTLASNIFESPQVKHEFPTRIWVYVSQEFNMRDVLLNILKTFTNQDMSRMSEAELVTTVRACLQDVKFLLVMDDVWTIEAWAAIRNVLPMKNWMGKILITSRQENVGRFASTCEEHRHMLRFLNQEESWRLLQLEVFGELNRCPKDLEHKGELIARQCDGLPLAIVVMGGILKDKVSNKEEMNQILDAWDDVSKNKSAYIAKNKDYNILKVVALSYNNLPDDLTNCFLYLGVYPKNYEIPVWTLTRLWIAEGFIEHKEGQSLEQSAEENLKDLINRNLVMVGTTNPHGKIKTCRVHDMIREFCISKALPEEHDLFQEIKKAEGVFDPPLSDRLTYHRICIHSNLQDFFSEIQLGKVKVKGAHSLLCFNNKSFVLDPKYNPIIPDKFESLRVLDSNSFKFPRLPDEFNKLIHIRYLTLLIDAELDSIPETVYELWNLQTLVINSKSRRLEINANIWKMYRLRHLKTKAAIVLDLTEEAAGNSGENLQTLSRLSPECCTEDVFKRVRNLKRLGVCGTIATLFKNNSLQNLDLLEDLKLVNELHNVSESEEPLPSLPPPKCFPRHIKRLTLSATYLDWEHMSTLGMIDTLEVLKLKYFAFKGQLWPVEGGFANLQFLLIDGTDLVLWEASDNDFPSLSCLVLKNCENLREIPLGFAKSLQILTIEREVPKSVVVSARKIDEKKKEMLQGAEKNRPALFMLSIGPGCE